MNKLSWLGLFLIAVALIAPAPTATAQAPPRVPPTFKQSHHDLPGGLDLDNPQEMMAQRLRDLHELHQFQDQVHRLMTDPYLRQSIGQLSATELQSLRQQLLKREDLRKDPSLDKLLQHATTSNQLDQRQIEELLRRLAKRAEDSSLSPSEPGLHNGTPGEVSAPSSLPPSDSMPSPSSSSSSSPSEPTLLDRMQEETTKWMMEHLDDVGGDVLESLAGVGKTEDVAPLAELLRSLNQPDFSELHVGEQAMALSRYLPKVGEFLHQQRGAWNEVRSLFRDAPVPSLPNLGAAPVSLPSASVADSNSTASALLSLLLFAVVLLLLSRMAARSRSRANSHEEHWRLGPWPVSPNAVSTRQDLIRAFEHLALLSLGLAARTCHHRALAERLAEQDSNNPARRQAAEMLAWMYEQARYAPDGESLSPEELSDARHALCCLAGVTAL